MNDDTDEIAVRLSGGLGNQLFQAAAGIAAAARYGREPVLDVSFFDKTKSARRYALDASSSDFRTARLLYGPTAHRIKRRFRETFAGLPRASSWTGSVYRQPGFAYDPGFAEVPARCLLIGDFQSPLFFAGAEERVRKAFDFSAALSPAAEAPLREILSGEAASVHVRRGDYAGDPEALRRHGLLQADYYVEAVERIRRETGCSRFFIFSDDHDQARALLGGDGFVHVRGTTAADDFHLMSRCRHHVIANSTFSWWAAYLGGQGTTVAPRDWFSPSWDARPDVRDLFPKDWTVL